MLWCQFQSSCPLVKVWLPIFVGNWSPSLLSTYSQLWTVNGSGTFYSMGIISATVHTYYGIEQYWDNEAIGSSSTVLSAGTAWRWQAAPVAQQHGIFTAYVGWLHAYCIIGGYFLYVWMMHANYLHCLVFIYSTQCRPIQYSNNSWNRHNKHTSAPLSVLCELCLLCLFQLLSLYCIHCVLWATNSDGYVVAPEIVFAWNWWFLSIQNS